MPTLDWIGKNKVINHHQDVPYHVLVRQYSFDEDGKHAEDNGSGNMIIHGDNLAALKSLLPRYEGKVKCIYIDPPYNTGNDCWKYSDNVNDPRIQKWLNKVVGKEGEDLCRHDKWLCMMYPRLKLLYKLLAKEGAIFISLDDNEVFNMKLLCDEIFGRKNFLGMFIWRKKSGGGQAVDYFVTEHEYVLAYAKDYPSLGWRDLQEARIETEYNKTDEKGIFKTTKLAKWGNTARRVDRPSMYFPIVAPDGTECYPVAPDGTDGRWRVGKATWEKLLSQDLVYWMKKGQRWEPYEKEYYNGQTKTIKNRSILYEIAQTGDGTSCLTDIFGEKDVFENPKPFELIQKVMENVCDEHAIVLDSFAGSATTAHAVLNKNKEDGGDRKFILIELGDYAETITAERVKRVIKGYTSHRKKTTQIFSKKISIDDLKSDKTLELAIAKKEEVHSLYDDIKGPIIKGGKLIVEGITNKESLIPGIGGNFSYYELGGPLLTEEHDLNEAVGVEHIRAYIWYMETRTDVPTEGNGNPHYLGTHNATAYYFYYEKESVTTLNHAFLATIPKREESMVIYADRCTLAPQELDKHGITFKKIPRDITKL